MVGTRSSARQAATRGNSSSSSQNKPSPQAGSKRKADSATTSTSKRGKKDDNKEQTTIEASMPSEETEDVSKDVEMKDEAEAKPAEVSNGKTGVDDVAEREADIRDQEHMGEETEDEAPIGEGKKSEATAQKAENDTNANAKDEGKDEPKKNGFDTIMANAAGAGKDDKKNATEDGTGSKVSEADNAVEGSPKREETTPSSILEKGIIYFFFRGRVGIDEPSNVNDIARSYIILRPLPHGAKLGEGPIGDANNIRLLSLPKKVLPVSPKDRFMIFVEKANASMEDGTYSEAIFSQSVARSESKHMPREHWLTERSTHTSLIAHFSSWKSNTDFDFFNQ